MAWLGPRKKRDPDLPKFGDWRRLHRHKPIEVFDGRQPTVDRHQIIRKPKARG